MKNNILIILIFVSTIVFGQKYFENRNDIPEKYKWKIEDIYANQSDWENDYSKAKQKINKLSKFKHNIASSDDLYNILSYIYNIGYITDKLTLFSLMTNSVNQESEISDEMSIKLQQLDNQLLDVTSWVDPAILKIPKNTILNWFKINKNLSKYYDYYKTIDRERLYILDEEKENLVNLFNNSAYAISDTYNELFYSDLSYPQFSDEKGNIISLNSVEYSKILNDTNRTMRFKAYKAYTNHFTSKRNTCASLLSANCNMTYAYIKAYGFNSVLKEDLFTDSVPKNVFLTMLETIKNHTQPLIKYHKLRAKALKLNNYQPADMYCSVRGNTKKYKYVDAKIIIKNSLNKLGREYLNFLDTMINERRIDVYENKNKENTVAYTTHIYNLTPYILTTYGEDITDIYVLIHELGHAVHAMFSMKNQTSINYESSILKDEVTSTINELFLTDYLLKNATNTQEELQILEKAIENMNYYYSQTFSADFSYQVYTSIENEEDLSASYLDEIYLNTYKAFYDNSVSNIEASNWTKYGELDFYNYKYVVSMTAALVFYNRISNGGDEELQQYLDFLKSGGNDFALAQLKKANIDLSDKSLFLLIPRYTKKLVDLYEMKLKEMKLINN